MNAQRWQRLDELFGRALELEPEDRRLLVEGEAGSDPELCRDLEGLLAAHAAADTFLDHPVVERPGSRQRPADWVGRRLGPWRLGEPLGAGSMGTVFEGFRAQGDFPLKVAVKVADRVAGSASLERRFRAERAILARLEHPGIARLLDGGTTDEGIPFLVLERVDGVPIDRFCRHLDLGGRIELFLEVCDAVRYAHRQLVIHRDLKPVHVLVTAEGRPKLLDFGIAKLLAPEPFDTDGELTSAGFWALTPAYASPEQLRHETVDTASDVYSLGVVLYKILTDRLPRQLESLGRSAVESALATAPEPPSAVLRRRAGVEPAKARLLRARRSLLEDLDAVVLQALEVDPAERYSSVERFGDDLRAVLEGRPVSARRPTLSYRLARGVARNRLAVSLGAAAFLALGTFSVVTARQARALERESSRSRHEQEATQAVATFLGDVLRDADPSRSGGREISVREAVDQSAQRLPERLAHRPQIHAGILHMVGSIYRGLGAIDQARPMLQEALTLRRESLGASSLLVADTLGELCALERENGEPVAAEASCRESLTILRRALPASDRRVVVATYELSSTLLTAFQLEPAVGLLEEALRIQRGDRSVPPDEIAVTELRLARAWAQLDRLEEAVRLSRSATDRLETASFAGSPRHAVALNSFADILWMAGRPAEAERLSARAEKMFIATLGPLHPRLSGMRNDRALSLHDLGRTAEATALLAATLEQAERAGGPSSIARSLLRVNLAEIRIAEGRPAEAEALLGPLMARLDDPSLDGVRPDLLLMHGAERLAQGDAEAAREAIEGALELRRRRLPAGHSAIAEGESYLGAALVAAGEEAAGRFLLDTSLHRLTEVLGADHPRTRAARRRTES
ncbi:MAG: tetratricopeptide repeat protein [Acidobacteria bacterium]|nr:tetratricopeptide repeat protein [Acidobacteriota bacterium]